jgi:hypothetical protein
MSELKAQGHEHDSWLLRRHPETPVRSRFGGGGGEIRSGEARVLAISPMGIKPEACRQFDSR